ncbi:MAG: DUF2341 domain-containing protein [Candidatus Bathyarchaeota archaeon]|nr:DUF2341 domain-containing protein [Candidatus Bathyarchaeum tardum]
MSSGVQSPLIVDINGDGYEEIIWPNTGHITCLDPRTGQIIWAHEDPYIYFWCQAQIADLNNDGNWEIIVPLNWYLESDMTGIMVLDALTGDTIWRIPESPGDTGGLGGTSHSSPVIADVNGDGFKEIFTVTTDIYTDPDGYDGTGKVVKLSHDGQILATQWSWRSCSGGLSIADIDEDGEFELYMGDRRRPMGQGVISYSATDLAPRWNDNTLEVSSNIPVLADVNGDGQLDVISSEHRGGIAVYNMDGSVIRKDLSFRFDDVLAGHYQHSVYDIDGDGNLEILVADGEHSDTSPDLVIFDLVDWTIDGRLLGETGLGNGTVENPTYRYMFMGPLIADVTGDGRMDIVTTSWDQGSQGGVHVFSYDDVEGFYLVDEYLFTAYNYPTRPTAQDIDNDGYVEIVFGYHGDGSQGGRVWAFDTPAKAWNHPDVNLPRPRSEVQFYSERRMGAAEYVPLQASQAPLIKNPYPGDGATGVPLVSELSVELSDYWGDPINYVITTSPNIGSGSGANVGNGRYSVPVTGLDYGTSYSWTVTADDGSHLRTASYSFTTMSVPEWWNSDWQNRKTITIDPFHVSEDQTNFPVLVDILDSDLIGAVQPDGDDIVFVDYGGTKLSHEIESFDSATGQLTAWVNLPFVSSSDYTNFFMYYNNPGAVNQQDSAGVWDASYKLVLHLSEEGSDCLDSTSSAHVGSVFGVVAQGAQGVIGGAYAFDGDSGYVQFPHSDTFAGYAEAFTASFWLNLDDTTRRQTILNKFDNFAGDMAWFVDYQNHATYGQVLSFFGSADGSNFNYYYAPFIPSVGTWYHVAVVWESNTVPVFYVNGEQIPTILDTTISSIFNNEDVPLEIGRCIYNSGRYLDGSLDEIRISNPARSASYILTSFNNQMYPALFSQIGNEESLASQPPVVSSPNPANAAVDVSVDTTLLNFTLTDAKGDLMDYYLSTVPDVGSGSVLGVSDGTYSLAVSGLAYSTEYTWWVNVTDGTLWTNMSYTFTTEAEPVVTYGVDLGSIQDPDTTSNLGTITFDGTPYALPDTVNVEASTYTITYTPAEGYQFSHWTQTGSITVNEVNAATTTTTITGTGTITAVYTETTVPVVDGVAVWSFTDSVWVPQGGQVAEGDQIRIIAYITNPEEPVNISYGLSGETLTTETATYQSTWDHYFIDITVPSTLGFCDVKVDSGTTTTTKTGRYEVVAGAPVVDGVAVWSFTDSVWVPQGGQVAEGDQIRIIAYITNPEEPVNISYGLSGETLTTETATYQSTWDHYFIDITVPSTLGFCDVKVDSGTTTTTKTGRYEVVAGAPVVDGVAVWSFTDSVWVPQGGQVAEGDQIRIIAYITNPEEPVNISYGLSGETLTTETATYQSTWDHYFIDITVPSTLGFCDVKVDSGTTTTTKTGRYEVVAGAPVVDGVAVWSFTDSVWVPQGGQVAEGDQIRIIAYITNPEEPVNISYGLSGETLTTETATYQSTWDHYFIDITVPSTLGFCDVKVDSGTTTTTKTGRYEVVAGAPVVDGVAVWSFTDSVWVPQGGQVAEGDQIRIIAYITNPEEPVNISYGLSGETLTTETATYQSTWDHYFIDITVPSTLGFCDVKVDSGTTTTTKTGRYEVVAATP